MDDGAHGSQSTSRVDTQANSLVRSVRNGALYALHAFQRPFVRSHAATVLLVTLYLCAGMIGHDPWKQDEAYTFGMVLHILQSGDWVVPTLGGEPFLEKPPLFYLVAALMAWLWSPWLPLHDGARLAAMAFIALGLLMTGFAARRLYGDPAMPRAVLLLLACLGLLQHAHEMITDTALFAGFAVAIYGLTWIQSSPRRAGAFFGSGIGIGFMSKGLVEPAVMALLCLTLPILSNTWRTRRFAAAMAWTAAFALPWLVIWPTALWRADPDAFNTWFWVNNVGRFTGSAHLGADTEPWYYLRVLPWFTFPAGPVAAFTIWKWLRHRADHNSTLLLTAVAGATLTVLNTAATARSLYALPLLIPLAILGSRSVTQLPEWLTRRFSILSTALFGSIALAIWAVWIIGLGLGHPPPVKVLLDWLPGDFTFSFSAGAFATALFYTLVWLHSWKSPYGSDRALHRWVAGVTMAWGVLMSLWLPWIDHAKSFRQPFEEIGAQIPVDGCLGSEGLGEPQRGMLHYVTGIITTPVIENDDECAFMLKQTNHRRDVTDAPVGWLLLWQGGRPGELDEQFSLYERSEDDEFPTSVERSRELVQAG